MILADDASSDDSVTYAEDAHPGVRVLTNRHTITGLCEAISTLRWSATGPGDRPAFNNDTGPGPRVAGELAKTSANTGAIVASKRCCSLTSADASAPAT